VSGIAGIVAFDDEFAASRIVAGGHVLDEYAQTGSGMNGRGEGIRHDREVQAALVAGAALLAVVTDRCRLWSYGDVGMIMPLAVAASAPARFSANGVAWARGQERDPRHVEIAVAGVAYRQCLEGSVFEQHAAEICCTR
jgi:hypothetical protein